jgi:TolB-like protein/tetratricopeptide (TPR) repeat protein
MTLSAGTRLGAYEILSPLGAGGMGEVYRARDSKLKRDVAIKVLPKSLAADADALARFEREALAVAALSHPNILAIHDFGTHEGTAYAVTELLEGETLRGKLETGPISERQAVDYALQVARGLSAAHEKRIVHRDLKPENLFVTRDGRVKILDFGLSKRVEAVGPGEETSAPTVSRQTEPGTVMGTMGYMSPEQVRGLPVDHRSDIFSFGAILYEMLTGKKAFSRPTAADTMSAILKEDPQELSESGWKTSPALARIVAHCLEKDRENRFQSASDVAFNLSEQSSPAGTSAGTSGAPSAGIWAGKRPVVIAVAAVLVLAGAGVLVLRRTPPGVVGTAGGVKRIAVLPFENLGSSEDDYFADGIADEVRAKLTSLPSLQVIARASSTPYKKTTKTPRQIAGELNTPYLLTATVRWEKGGGASRVHVIPELVDVTRPDAPTSRWQQPFDAALTNVFQVQSEIASQVAHSLGVALGAGEEKRLSEKPTQSLAAYDAFLKGEEVWKGLAVGDPPGLRKALGFYEQAVALDPAFAQAWARISWGAAALYGNSVRTPALADRAREAAEKAVALAPGLPEAYLALGNYQRLVLNNSERAMDQYNRGNRVGRTNADLLWATAMTEEALGRWDSALEHFRQANRLDPRSVPAHMRLSQVLLFLRRYPESRAASDKGLAVAPANLQLIENKAMAFLGEGDLPAARAVLHAAPRELEPTTLVAGVANAYDLVWILDDQQRALLLRLTPVAFDEDRAIWALCLLQAAALEVDTQNVQRYAEIAATAFQEQLRSSPDEALRRVFHGLALAYLGRKEEAIREGERGAALLPLARDAATGAYLQHQLARIYIVAGEPEKALDRLEPLLRLPYILSPGWLRIDPNFDPLRKNPRFQKLVV